MSAVTSSLKARTGRSLDEWVALVQASDVDDDVRSWLAAAYEQNGP